MQKDLSVYHQAISDLFSLPAAVPAIVEDWQQHKLTDQQVRFFHENGYLAGVRILRDEQVEALREQLNDLMNPAHEGHDLFYEFHSNESLDPAKVLFHALGAWRIEPGFHDILWHPAFVVPASQLLGGDVRFWHDQLFCKPALHAKEKIAAYSA